LRSALLLLNCTKVKLARLFPAQLFRWMRETYNFFKFETARKKDFSDQTNARAEQNNTITG